MPDYFTCINYTYDLSGKSYSGNRVFYDQSEDTLRHPFGKEDYKQNSAVLMHYNPENPAQAVLTTEPQRGASDPKGYWQGAILGVSLVAGGLFRWRQTSWVKRPASYSRGKARSDT
jgi:hypothetical protein